MTTLKRKELYSIRQAAKLLEIDYQVLHRRCLKGVLPWPANQIACSLYYTFDDLHSMRKLIKNDKESK